MYAWKGFPSFLLTAEVEVFVGRDIHGLRFWDRESSGLKASVATRRSWRVASTARMIKPFETTASSIFGTGCRFK